jgi:hypothetical protein
LGWLGLYLDEPIFDKFSDAEEAIMWPTIFTLTGLLADIAGGFILSIEAIGAHRVKEWGTRLLRSSYFGWLLAASFVASLVLAIFTLDRFAIKNDFLQIFIVLVISIGSALTLLLIVEAIERTGHALIILGERARINAVGLLGFGLIAAGFVLQFVGTLWSAFEKE